VSVKLYAAVANSDGEQLPPISSGQFSRSTFGDLIRFRVLRLYRQLNHRSSLAFFRDLREAMPFPIKKLQSDNGTEFSLEFALTVQDNR
jgi:hypothetical protein